MKCGYEALDISEVDENSRLAEPQWTILGANLSAGLRERKEGSESQIMMHFFGRLELSQRVWCVPVFNISFFFAEVVDTVANLYA